VLRSRSATRFRRRRPLARPLRVERFLRELYEDAKRRRPTACSPTSTFRRPSSSISRSSTLRVQRLPAPRAELRAYLARLQHIAGQKPLLLAEAGADSIREGETARPRSPRCTSAPRSRRARAARSRFAWTDEWWRGGYDVDDWAFGLVDRERRRSRRPLAVARRNRPAAPFFGAVRSPPAACVGGQFRPTTPPPRSTGGLSSTREY
jgi:hypothetical protein